MTYIGDLLKFYGLADLSLPSPLQAELPMLSRGVLPVADTLSSVLFNVSDLFTLTFKDTFLNENFGPSLSEVYVVLYPTSLPVYDNAALSISWQGVAIVSYGTRYDQLYQNLLQLYDFSRSGVSGYITSPANAFQVMEFPLFTSLQSILQTASNDTKAIVIPLTFSANNFAPGTTDTFSVQVTIAVDTASLSSSVLESEVFMVDTSTSTPITFTVSLPADATSPPTSINTVPFDALIFGHPISDGTVTVSPFPLTFKYHWVGSGYEELWFPSETVYALRSLPPSGDFWSDPVDTSIFDTTSQVPTHPIGVAVSSVTRDIIDEAEPLFVITPEFAFPVDSATFVSNPSYTSVNDSISNFVVSADCLYIPVVEGTEDSSTVNAWETFANLIRPSLAEAQARYVLFGPILVRADGTLNNAGIDILKNWVSNFDVRYHLPPAGLVRGLVGGVLTSYPYLYEDADLNSFVVSRVNPIKRTPAGWAVFGTMTLYNDDASYKGHNYTMVLTRIVKRLILRLLPRALYESPTRLSEVAGAIERIVNSLNGVTMEIVSVSYDPASQTGQIRANLYLEGVLEAIEFVISISFQGVEVNL